MTNPETHPLGDASIPFAAAVAQATRRIGAKGAWPGSVDIRWRRDGVPSACDGTFPLIGFWPRVRALRHGGLTQGFAKEFAPWANRLFSACPSLPLLRLLLLTTAKAPDDLAADPNDGARAFLAFLDFEARVRGVLDGERFPQTGAGAHLSVVMARRADGRLWPSSNPLVRDSADKTLVPQTHALWDGVTEAALEAFSRALDPWFGGARSIYFTFAVGPLSAHERAGRARARRQINA